MLTAMGTIRLVSAGAVLAGAVILTGCASTSAAPTATPTPTVTVSANQAACDAFSKATSTMSDALNTEDDINEAWGAVRDNMDAAALQASGDVKERLATLVDEWPRGAELWVYQDFDGINQMLKDVGRACEADDAEVDVYTFVTD